jgi:hypothetical protein
MASHVLDSRVLTVHILAAQAAGAYIEECWINHGDPQFSSQIQVAYVWNSRIMTSPFKVVVRGHNWTSIQAQTT